MRNTWTRFHAPLPILVGCTFFELFEPEPPFPPAPEPPFQLAPDPQFQPVPEPEPPFQLALDP